MPDRQHISKLMTVVKGKHKQKTRAVSYLKHGQIADSMVCGKEMCFL